MRSREVWFSAPVAMYAARPVSLLHVGCTVLGAPRLRDRRGNVGADGRRDQWHPRFPRCARLASTTQRMQFRGRSPRTIFYGRTHVFRSPTPGGRGSPPLRRMPQRSFRTHRRGRRPRRPLRRMTGNEIASHPRCTNPSVTPLRAATAPLSGEPRGGWRFAAFTHLFTAMLTPTFRSRP